MGSKDVRISLVFEISKSKRVVLREHCVVPFAVGDLCRSMVPVPVPYLVRFALHSSTQHVRESARHRRMVAGTKKRKLKCSCILDGVLYDQQYQYRTDLRNWHSNPSP